MATRIKFTNKSKNARAVQEAGRMDMTTIPVGETKSLLVGDGELKNLKAMATENPDAYAVEEVGQEDENAGSSTLTTTTQPAPGAGKPDAGENEFVVGEINLNDLDDDQLKLLIKEKTEEAPHPLTGRPKLLAKAKAALEAEAAKNNTGGQ